MCTYLEGDLLKARWAVHESSSLLEDLRRTLRKAYVGGVADHLHGVVAVGQRKALGGRHWHETRIFVDVLEQFPQWTDLSH